MTRRWKALRAERIVTVVLLLAGVFFSASPTTAQGRPKVDVVILKNGDRITGEIKGLLRGKLSLKTDWMGTVDIEWDNIERVESPFRYTAVLASGVRLVGSLNSGVEVQSLAVIPVGGDRTTIPYQNVVGIAPLEQTFWQRMKGSIDLGFSFSQANTSTQWDLNAEASHQTNKYLATTDLSSTLQDQEGGVRNTRNSLTLGYQWFLRNRWYTLGLSQLQQSESQGLDLRALLGGGVGRHVYRSVKTDLSILGGVDATREKYTGEDFITTGEAFAGIRWETHRFDHPKLDITGHFFTFPNLTTWGRLRVQAQGKVRFEIVKDLYFSVNLYESFDTDPPIEDVAKNDFSISTSLGWTF